MFRRRQNGVALIITVIMLSVITFMAVTFLAVSRRDKNLVATATDQTTARLAADAALERAKAETLAPILAATNAFNFDLLVSTNYVNRNGFTNGVSDPVNVNYDYDAYGNPLTPANALQNLANLLYSPRPPVFVVTNRATGSNEFRFYLDLNRNRRYDPSGLWPVTNELGQAVLTNGVIVNNFFVGDPEWIGQLARPEFPHSATNLFTSRYAYLVLPAGKTLDVNYIHNQAFNPNKVTLDQFGRDFLRNQGAGSWEINLASFLYDLNTNLYAWGGNFAYNPLTGIPTDGNAFVDAGEIYRYRLNGLRTGLAPVDYAYNVNNLFDANTALGSPAIFGSDFIDGYSAGPLMMNYYGLTIDSDAPRMGRPWSGSGNFNHFFTTQDFFDPNKSSANFVNRLANTAAANSSYDRYTYYRMLAQLGTDSAPEPPDKLNLNYDNLVARNPITGSVSATNFFEWRSLDFFTNAAERLVRHFTTEWLARDRNSFVRTFGTTNSFGVFAIPVWMNNTQFVYEASVHRLLQLAANLHDATTNSIFPSVFRPRFSQQVTNVLGTGTLATNILITGFEEAPYDINGASAPPLDVVNFPANRTFIGTDTLTNVVGVPWIIGAKKGFPNFNEFTMRSVVSVSRRLEFQKRYVKGPMQTTNQFYYIGISNAFGLESWNSYATPYPRELQVLVGGTGNVAITNANVVAGVTNYVPVTNVFFDLSTLKPPTNYPANSWRGFPLDRNSTLVPLSFRFMSTNVVAWPQLMPAVSGTNSFPVPFWRVYVKARLQYALVDTGVIPNRIVDYVHPGFEDSVDIMDQLTKAPELFGEPDQDHLRKVWDPIRLGSSTDPRVPTYGIKQQIEVSLKNVDVGNEVWTDYNAVPVASGMKLRAIDGFRVFMGYSPISYPPGSIADTNRMIQAPYNPARKFFVSKQWQANDPLVHYMASDLLDPELGRQTFVLKPYNSQPPGLTNLGTLNERYRPWGGRPGKDPASDLDAYNLALKDPLIRRSDDWNFPSNKLATLGWIGRIHRGTPWQTVYLKSMGANDLPEARWQNWTGNTNAFLISDPSLDFSRPEADRHLLDMFTVALNDNASRGRLSINQSGLAAWSAALSGVIVLSNTLDSASFEPGVEEARVIEPAGAYDPNAPDTWPPLVKLVTAINDVRATNFAKGAFTRLGDILAVPELTLRSPFLNLASDDLKRYSVRDTVYEWLPQQVLSLLQLGGPRFVVYSYGQTLRPANRSIITSGPFFGMCTNYQITAEVTTRAVVRIEGAPTNSHAVIENYNILPPD